MFEEPIKIFAKRSERYPQADDTDMLHASARAALSAIPGIGGPLTELFSLVIAPTLSHRRDEWFKELADAIEQLEVLRDQFKPENLVNDERFVSAVIQTTRSAVATHEVEKRAMLRNALLNSIANPCPMKEMEELFFGMIDSFSVSHIKVLKFMWTGVHDLNKAGKWDPLNPYRYGEWLKPLGEIYPEFKNQDGFVSCLMSDLRSKALSNIARPSDAFPQSPAVTNMGIQFLNFILEPPK